MFDYLRRDNAIDMSEEDAAFVKALIVGDREQCNIKEKAFLFEIVANQRNGFDVDKSALFSCVLATQNLRYKKIGLHCPRLSRNWREN